MNFMQLIIVILKIYNYQKSLMGQESSLRVKEVDHMEPKVTTLSLGWCLASMNRILDQRYRLEMETKQDSQSETRRSKPWLCDLKSHWSIMGELWHRELLWYQR